MKIIYQSRLYNSNAVTGVYVRCHGRKGSYLFRTYETTGQKGQGPTVREYDTDGAELPEAFRDQCIASKQTEKLR